MTSGTAESRKLPAFAMQTGGVATAVYRYTPKIRPSNLSSLYTDIDH